MSNIAAKDDGKEIMHGNGKVVRARLSDAAHFYKRDQRDMPDLGDLKESAAKFGLDLKKPLDQRMAKLDHLGVTFHAKLGSQGERVERIQALAAELAKITGADAAKVDRAVVLAKADLRTEAVGEFPELQGLMGRKYAILQGEDADVAAAIEEHYKPLGPSDSLPTNPVAVTVALADKLDTLVGFWAIDEKPTGSKDPYALRRAALGVIRVLLEKGVRVALGRHLCRLLACLLRMQQGDKFVFFQDANTKHSTFVSITALFESADWPAIDGAVLDSEQPFYWIKAAKKSNSERTLMNTSTLSSEEWEKLGQFVPMNLLQQDLLSFFHDRLKVYLRDLGARHDIIDAVLTPMRMIC